VTGVTIMLMDAGMDTGPVLTMGEAEIQPDDTTESLSQRLAALGAGLLRDTLPRWVAGEIQPQPQPNEGVTTTRLIQKEDGLIDWSRPAVEIQRAVRAYQPWPGAYTLWRGDPLKVLKASVVAGQGQPGRVVAVPGGVAVATGEGALRLDEVQPAGRRPMPGKAFVNGAKDFIGSHL
jgi:methionyl-tRNA formyltransferase